MRKRLRKKLEIACTSTDCKSGLHCFQATQKMKKEGQQGRCRECGVELVDWPRVRRRDLRDAEHTFSSLRLERIRHHYWHIEIDQRAINYALRKGWKNLEETVAQRLRTSIGGATPFHDGFQTPWENNPIYYAQHAIAGCCRKCVEYWHGIARGKELTGPEISYLKELSMLYLRERLPELSENGVHVPPIQSRG